MRNKKLLFKIFAIVVLLIGSFGMYYSYENITDVAKVNNKQARIEEILQSNSFLRRSVYVLDYKLLQQEGKTKKASDYLQFNQFEFEKDQEIIALDKQRFNENFENYWIRELENEPNVFYNFMDQNSKKKYSNTNDSIEFIDISPKLMDKYQWYVTLTFDENGNMSFSNYSDFKKHGVFEDLSDIYLERYSDSKYEKELQPIKNCQVTFAVPSELKERGQIYWGLENDYEYYMVYLLPCILVGAGIVLLFMLFAPVRLVKECNPYKSLIRLKAEILLFIGGSILIGGYSFIAMLSMMSENGEILDLIENIRLEGVANSLIMMINILSWMIYLQTIMFVVFWLKYIFHKGFFKYIKENTILGWLISKFKYASDTIVTFDLEDEINRNVVKIVAINFFVLTAICVVFGFNIFITIIYSIVLFFFLRNYLIKIKKDYQTLLNATKRLSNGDFNIEIKEELGLFNSLRDEFANIKDGFEKAVNEEVKSQRMKTELISNVSHDLKTPLTSIITYVDLLRKEGVSDQEKEAYLDTIDRNSIRLKNLIEDLFEVSKANSGNVNLNLVDVDIVALIKQVHFECEDKMHDLDLDLKIICAQEKIVCSLDSSKTYRIFENLFINICKYALAHTRVYINVEEDESSVIIIFKNISANEIDFDALEIVERFVQGDKSRNIGGSGLGLAIVKSFVELQNGTFTIEVDGDLFKAIVQFKKS